MTGGNPPEAGRPAAGGPDRSTAPAAGRAMRDMWIYTILRFGLFLALWGILWLVRVPGFLAAMIAIILSLPLSYVLLRRQRDRVAQNLEHRIEGRRARTRDLNQKLSGGDSGVPGGVPGDSP